MFENYTDKARRVIFFARYEAGSFGSPYIESEHLLLGVLREDKPFTRRFLRSHSDVEAIRREIEAKTTVRESSQTSVDIPLSWECKRVLTHAAEEAKTLGHKEIGNEHLLLGIFREEKCLAADILKERGVQADNVREVLARSAEPSLPSAFEPTPLDEAFTLLNQPSVPERLDTLSQSVKSLAAEGKLANARIQSLAEIVSKQSESIERLLRIVESRERRPTDIEGEKT